MLRTRFFAIALVLTASALPQFPGARAARTSIVEAGVLQGVDPIAVIARFDERIPSLPRGFEQRYRFASVPAVYGIATPAAARELARLPGLAHLGRDKAIEVDLETATIASRAKAVWDPAAPQEPIVVAGKVVDGAGVGVAIVDTGLDGTHPDFQVPAKVRGNYLVTPDGVVATPYSNGGNAHGTHVAGIAAGNGFASGGVYRGAAPGASLYAFGMGAASIAIPSIAFDWILEHGHEQDPPIRVVNNSWHCKKDQQCRTFNPDDIHIVLATKLVESGVTITWSAGNDGGDGFLANTNLESRNPTPGIISVANYDDDERGLRTKCVSGSSSRGAASAPETWPDLAAPGRQISSTWAMGPSTGPVQETQNTRTPDGRNMYRQATGTSMAAPHVAGIAALMLQANPSLTPGDVEYLLKATASKLDCTMRGRKPNPAAADPIDREPAPQPRADASHPFDGANFIEGHGLVDARAAVEAALAFSGIPDAPPVEDLPESYQRIRVGLSSDRTFFARETDELSEAVPTEDAGAHIALSDTELTFTSEATGGFSTDGLHVEAWIGTSAEYEATFLGRRTTVHEGWADLGIRVERVGEDGTETFVDAVRELRLVPAAAPVYRRWSFPLPDRVTLAPGDRIRLSLSLRSELPADEAKIPWVLYADAQTTPTNVAFGSITYPVTPESSLECRLRYDCAEIGGPRMLTAFDCDTEGTLPDHPTLRVRWTGPAGSTAGARCQGNVVTCTVPGEPATDPWGTCEAEIPMVLAIDTYDSWCFYRTRDGEMVNGDGRCDQFPVAQEPQE